MIALVIPTRNRAGLAMEAIGSLLRAQCELQIFVSDNSTSEDAARTLDQFCRPHARVTYLRPAQPLPMAAHWDWALRETLLRSDAAQIGVFYDRKVARPRMFERFARAVARFPDRVLTYPVDHVTNVPEAYTVWQTVWTGKSFALRTARAIELTVEGRIRELGHALPLLSNCVVPRAALEAVLARFGSICDSTTPDCCFAYRFCALAETYVHCDLPIAVVRAPDRSAGMGYLRGAGGDFADFRNAFGDRAWLAAAPIPALNLGHNMLFHEYNLVRQEALERALPPLQMDGYLRNLAEGLEWIEDAAVRRALRALLEEHGWREERGSLAKRRRLIDAIRGHYFRFRAAAFLAEKLRIRPPHVSGFGFDTDKQALHFALLCERAAARDNPSLAPLAPVEIGENEA